MPSSDDTMPGAAADRRSLIRPIDPGNGRVILLVVAHADDPTLFIGGTVAAWSAGGWRVSVARATDDRWDSVGLDEVTTKRVGKEQFDAAMAVLGVAEVIEYGLPTDTLTDADRLGLRERVIRDIRRLKPYALVTFDPKFGAGEDNQDHVVVATAVDEAAWTSQFDLHHPEHRAEGLEPHGVFERWYFGRPVSEVTDVIDTSSFVATKVAAAVCHEAALRNFLNQLRLQAKTGGWRIPLIDEALSGDIAPVVEALLTQNAATSGERYGLGAAEEFRVERFSGLEELLGVFGERIE